MKDLIIKFYLNNYLHCIYFISFLDIESYFMPLSLDAESINYGDSWQWRFTLWKCP